jgi:hypothetical protein
VVETAVAETTVVETAVAETAVVETAVAETAVAHREPAASYATAKAVTSETATAKAVTSATKTTAMPSTATSTASTAAPCECGCAGRRCRYAEHDGRSCCNHLLAHFSTLLMFHFTWMASAQTQITYESVPDT